MIRYSLRCAKAHDFDSWFQSAEAFDALQAAGHVSCPICGDARIEKSLMAPAVRPARQVGEVAKPVLTQPQNDIEAAFAEMRRQIETKSDYVGLNFVAEARRMHAGEIDERSIWGEAKPEEARALMEDGVKVAPLPFMPSRKAN
jgi:hypothetical protein